VSDVTGEQQAEDRPAKAIPPATPPGVVMLDLEGHTVTDDERALLLQPPVGGVILFSRNVADRDQVKALVAELRSIRADLLIAVDQEGGRVQRLRKGFTPLPAMARFGELYASDPAQAVALCHDCGWLMATEVLSVGIDFSFAPVLDVGRPISAVIGDRAFSEHIPTLIALAGAFLRGMKEAGMPTTGKHFPGHGGVAADSHTDIPVDDRPLSVLESEDLLPFYQCLPLLDAIMPAHVIYSQVDMACAGFSSFWLQTMLRGELGFDGVIFSDDLVMAGAAAAGSMADRVDAALAAGCDMLLVCNDRAAALEALAHVNRAHSEQITNARLTAMRVADRWTLETADAERMKVVASQVTALETRA